MKSNRKFNLPGVDRLLRDESCQILLEEFGHDLVCDAVRDILSVARSSISDGESPPSILQLLGAVKTRLQEQASVSLMPLYNLTGTVLHTNLGRSPLPETAIQAMSLVAAHATNLEFDISTGKRGDRDSLLEQLLREMTGAEAATVVNNNAAAVFLVLNTLAAGKQVPVSRGELVEIGGSFRIPDIMARSGCQLIEIGTTNRTHPKDYMNAINEQTALLMKVHTSNYQISGFTVSVSDQQVAEIASTHDLPFVTDLGSGTLVDLRRYGLPFEPTVRNTLAHGADLVTFSGDKLLGGPQAGLIVGKANLIAKIKANPLKRALRVDKMTIAALQEVLKLYRNPDKLADHLPTLRLLSRDLADITRVADMVLPDIAALLQPGFNVSIIDCSSQIGSGSLPIEELASKAIAIKTTEPTGSGKRLLQLSDQLRSLPCPILGRITHDALLLDLRCLEDPDPFLAQLAHLKTAGTS